MREITAALLGLGGERSGANYVDQEALYDASQTRISGPETQFGRINPTPGF
jgi:hypothetical protein